MPSKFTQKQGRYLAFVHQYTLLHGQAPAETDMLRFFRTSPSAVHQMVLTLERNGLVTRAPGQARSIKVAVPVNELPPLEILEPGGGKAGSTPSRKERDDLVPRLVSTVLQKLFDAYELMSLDDGDFAPLVCSVAEAVTLESRMAGASPEAARAAREAVLDMAVGIYVRLCVNDLQ